ncbi:MAG: hypothetical protein M3542_13355 [Acidobacteriota bacterium]|nr:hypothetical protein [Acidobacteriota bacterium]MDQ5870812.1 hypothetical protein [Acidobacteriota bacterium]
MKLAVTLAVVQLVAFSGTALPAPAGGLSVSAGDVTDRRRNDNFFGGLEIELKIGGDGAAGVRGARALVKKAEDETGRNLLKEGEKKPDFETSMSDSAPTLKLELRNPARKAKKVREVSGQVELYLPARDPAAVARLDGFLSRMDRPAASPALKAAQTEVTVVSRKTYDAEKKKDAERRRKEAESAGIGGAMVEAFSGLFEGLMGDIEENDVLVKVTDPGKKVFNVEVYDAKGAKIDGAGSMTVGTFRILKFPEKLPADASLRVYLLTPKSVVTTPFQLKDVALP